MSRVCRRGSSQWPTAESSSRPRSKRSSVHSVGTPSTRLRDLGLKRRCYEDAGLPWYWIVNPKKPRLTVLRLVGDRFVEHAVVTGDEEYVSSEPVEVTVVPSALVS